MESSNTSISPKTSTDGQVRKVIQHKLSHWPNLAAYCVKGQYSKYHYQKICAYVKKLIQTKQHASILVKYVRYAESYFDESHYASW